MADLPAEEPPVPPPGASAARSAALGVSHLAAGRPKAALVALRTAIALGGRSPATLLNLALAEDRVGETASAQARMRLLADRLPDWDEPRLRLAESLRNGGKAEAAEALYEQVLALNPNRPEALISLGVLRLQRGDAADACLKLLRCCGRAPERMEAWDAVGIASRRIGQAHAAAVAFAEASRLAPGNIGIALRRVDAALASGAGEAELARLEQAMQADPLDAVQLTARGVLLEQLGRRDEATEILEAATTLAPGLPEAASALAHVLVRSERMAQAIPALERALALSPLDRDLHNNHAAALVRVHRHREACAELEALIAEHGEHPAFLCNLTNALVSQGLQADGLRVARRAVAVAPEQNLAWRTLSNALPYCEGVSGAELLEVNRRAGASLPRRNLPALRNDPDPARRLRVGLLSSTLKTHPVGWLTLAGWEALDRDDFEIICLGQPESDDALQRRFRAVASEWHVVDRASGVLAADRIRALGIDVLVELSGYGDRGLMTLCADRLAPVQVKWVGSQNHSSGLGEMDWFLSDRWETPSALAPFYSERLLTLPDGYVCYSPPAYAPDIGALPMAAAGRVTFGCFNNLAKVTGAVIATWAGILHRLPEARMVLKCHQLDDADMRRRVQGAFAAHGLEERRVELRGSSPHRVLLDQYNDVDIVLDPFPYSGGLTTCEALWMGVPVITMPGETFASRHSTSHLSNAGLGDWVAADVCAYQALAMHWANAPEALAALRAEMRARLKASPLCDGARFGRSLGGALRRAWEEWCGRERKDVLF